MNHTLPSATNDSLVARWALAGAAAGVGLFLMIFYVQLLQESVARGAQWRYSQATAQTASVTAPAAVRLVNTAAR